MADRTVKVNLIAVTSGYVAGMNQASAATNALANNSAAKLAAQRQAFNLLGNAALGFGVAAAAATVLAIAKFAEFDKAMSQVNAVTEASTAEMNALRDAALDAGGRTVFTAVEAAHALEELAKAGFNTNQAISGLDGTLDLAASGQLEVARASEITATTLKQFNLSAGEAGRVADVLSAGANKALGSVEDLAQGLKFVGPVAGAMGISLEDTTATLALFADQGIIGEQAGSAFRGMLASLQNPSKAAQAQLDDLNISLYDSEGAFIGMGPLVEKLNTALGDVDDQTRDTALGLIFTNAQLTTAQTLVGEAGAKWNEYRDDVEQSGFAAQVAAERLNNLSGDIEKLGGALDTALIKTGSGANDVLRNLVQSVTFLVDAFNDAPSPVQDAALAVGAVATAAGLVVGVTAKAIPAIADFRGALDTLKVSGSKVAVAVGAVTAAVTIATLVIGAFVAEQAASKARVDSFADSLDDATGAVTAYTRELVVKKLEEKGAFEDSEKYGITQRELTDAVLEGGAALEVVNGKVDSYTDGLTTNEKRLQAASISNGTMAVAIRTTRDELEQAATANRNATAATDDNRDALAELEGKADDTAGAVDDLADKIRNFGSAQFDVNAATRNFEAAIDDLTQSVVDNGTSLDYGTEQGRNNLAAIDDLAQGTLDLSAATLAQTGDQDAANVKIAEGRQRLIEALEQFGITGQAAEDYADNLGLIPDQVATAAVLTGADQVERDLNYLARNRYATIYVGSSGVGGGPGIMIPNATGGFYERGLPIQAFANGGFPSGTYRGGQNIHKFAETGLPWETYISPKPGHERENIGYAIDALSRLGVNLADMVGNSKNAAQQPGGASMPAGNQPVRIATESADAIGYSVARYSRQFDRQGGVTNG